VKKSFDGDTLQNPVVTMLRTTRRDPGWT